MTNKEIVQQMYDAFGRRDIQTLLSNVADDVEWIVPGSKAIPTAGNFRGKDQVARFFKMVADTTEFDVFEPRQFIAEGEQVAVIGRYTARLKGTRDAANTDWTMIFTLRNGKVVNFQEFYDTGSVERVFERANAARA